MRKLIVIMIMALSLALPTAASAKNPTLGHNFYPSESPGPIQPGFECTRPLDGLVVVNDGSIWLCTCWNGSCYWSDQGPDPIGLPDNTTIVGPRGWSYC